MWINVFEKEVKKLAEELGNEEIARLYLSAESITFSKDGQDRTVIPSEYITDTFKGQEIYVISVQGKTPEENYIDIYPRVVYDKMMDEVLQKTTYFTSSGLKGEIKKLKGEGDEKGRGKA